MLVSSRGIGGIETCDIVVDGSGNAVDCSSWGNFFNSACWNPLAPCASTNSTVGQPATVDNSLSQLGGTVASVVEGNATIGGVSVLLIVGVVAAILILR